MKAKNLNLKAIKIVYLIIFLTKVYGTIFNTIPYTRVQFLTLSPGFPPWVYSHITTCFYFTLPHGELI